MKPKQSLNSFPSTLSSLIFILHLLTFPLLFTLSYVNLLLLILLLSRVRQFSSATAIRVGWAMKNMHTHTRLHELIIQMQHFMSWGTFGGLDSPKACHLQIRRPVRVQYYKLETEQRLPTVIHKNTQMERDRTACRWRVFVSFYLGAVYRETSQKWHIVEYVW